MSLEPTAEQLITRLRRGDSSAASTIYHRFVNRLIALASSWLDERMRRKVDPEEVVLSACRSLFRHVANDEFEILNWEGLWGLLVQFTLSKTRRRLQYFRAARRDVRREVHGENISPDEQDELVALAADPQPTPCEVIELTDTVEEVMRRLGSDRKRKIFELSLQGYSIAEISAAVGHYERGVERVRAQIKKLLLEMQAGPEAPQ